MTHLVESHHCHMEGHKRYTNQSKHKIYTTKQSTIFVVGENFDMESDKSKSTVARERWGGQEAKYYAYVSHRLHFHYIGLRASKHNTLPSGTCVRAVCCCSIYLVVCTTKNVIALLQTPYARSHVLPRDLCFLASLRPGITPHIMTG